MTTICGIPSSGTSATTPATAAWSSAASRPLPGENAGRITLEGSRDADGSYNFGNPAALLVKDAHIGDDAVVQETYRRQGASNNLLWFPETYRRPDENRENEPMHTQLAKDFRFFANTAVSRDSWVDALDYVLFRNLDHPWFTSQYYTYLP